MLQRTTFLLLFLSTTVCFAQLTGKQLLEKAIQYHDPQGVWSTFRGVLKVTMETPKRPNRDSEISIDLPNEYFKVTAKQGTNTTEYTLNKGKCGIRFNGNSAPDAALKKKYNLSCDRANLYKNYYSYLYGLPMKLKDPGTLVEDKVAKINFKGKNYLVVKVSYEKGVGTDVWFFYFNPKSYAMEIYQFLKNGEPNSGEYILLSGEAWVQGIRMPKIRAWYYNKNDVYLGTDLLTSSSKLEP